MRYQKVMSVGGSWVKAGELKPGVKAKIISETTPSPSSFTNKDGSVKMQDVAKVKFQGATEAVNVSLNRATINGLVEAYGEDSKDWMNKVLSVETEKVRVAGAARIAVYLIPDGFVKIDDENGYAKIVRADVKVVTSDSDIPVINTDIDEEPNKIDEADLPFN